MLYNKLKFTIINMKESTWSLLLAFFFLGCLIYDTCFRAYDTKAVLVAIFDAAMMIITWIDYRFAQIKEQ